MYIIIKLIYLANKFRQMIVVLYPVFIHDCALQQVQWLM